MMDREGRRRQLLVIVWLGVSGWCLTPGCGLQANISGADVVPVNSVPSMEGTPEDHPSHCRRTCRRIGALYTRADIPASWLEQCQRACVAHAGSGQLDCFDRARRVEDLRACAAR